MAYHDDLLRQAFQLVLKERKNPKQASLRRGVSAAYYALFHLLVHEAVGNWNKSNLRESLGRAFDHQPMRAASNRVADLKAFPFHGEDPIVVGRLRSVARTFAYTQEKRHKADYDNASVWTRAEALEVVKRVEHAFAEWKAIRNEQIAQAYLVSLLVKNR